MMSIQEQLSSLSSLRSDKTYTLVAFLACILLSSSAYSKNPADVFSQRIILSKKSFPSSFKNDKSFITYMKRTHLKKVVYPDDNRLTLRFMAFFSRPIRTTEFTALVYDLSDRNRLVATIPISPSQRETRILASSFDIEMSDFPEEHRYKIMVAVGTTALAQTTFTIKESRKNRTARRAKEKRLRRNSKVDFSR